MRDSKRLQEERAYVDKALAKGIICKRCGATLRTYATVCAAELSDMCPGFIAIEKAKEDFAKQENAR